MAPDVFGSSKCCSASMNDKMSGPPVASRSTRRSATVTISVPLAANASRIASPEENLPVPTIRRDAKARPAITSGSSRRSSMRCERPPIRWPRLLPPPALPGSGSSGRRRRQAASQPGAPSSPRAWVFTRIIRPASEPRRGRSDLGHEVDRTEQLLGAIELGGDERRFRRAFGVVLREQEQVQRFVRADLHPTLVEELADRELPREQDVVLLGVPVHVVDEV